jgi:uncharacterized protein
MNTVTCYYFFAALSLPYALSGSISSTANGNDCFINTQYLTTELLKYTKQGDFFSVSYLLDQGADPNTTYAYNNTILSVALLYKHYAIAELLLDCGADPNIQNYFGSAPIYTAIATKDKSALQLLLTHNADPNICDRLGNTPLHSAAYRGEPELVQLLLEHGADIHIQNIHGYTAQYIASSQYLVNDQARPILQALLYTVTLESDIS